MAGQIIKRGERKFLVRVYHGRRSNGKRIYKSKTINGTKKDAQMFLNARLREKDLGGVVFESQTSLDEYLDHWLETVVTLRVRPQTYEGYKGLLKTHIRSRIGHLRLTEITSNTVQEIYNGMLDLGKTGRTVRYVHAVISSAFKHAFETKQIRSNPCDGCTLPKIKKPEILYLTPDESNAFLREARSDRYATLFRLAIETGMRPGEYLGLKWTDITFGRLATEQSTLTIRRALVRRKGGGFELGDVKTAKSRRSIPVSMTLSNSLREHRVSQNKEMLKTGIRNEFDLVFTTRIGTPVSISNLRRRNFKKVVKESGVPNIGLHGLRHTMATLLLLGGENPKVVSERLGHSSVVQTLDTYSHVLPSMQVDATNNLEAMLIG